MESLAFWLLQRVENGLSIEHLLIYMIILFWTFGVMPIVVAFIMIDRLKE
ncbi:Uncharacterised protein [Serratia fonticola]|nr:Uncharacterised protein [Serratia fonticola]CAI1708085.1 Uncharacterised protein [Serratia fonticola]CAI1886878.1 Uncharacterised protein [Serratia fonticola]